MCAGEGIEVKSEGRKGERRALLFVEGRKEVRK